MSDSELVALAAKGHVEAFERLYGKYHAFILGCAGKLTQPYERELRRDVAQDVWLRLAEGRWHLAPHPQDSLHAFVATLVRCIILARRPQGPHARTARVDPWLLDEMAVSQFPHPLDTLISAQQLQQLSGAWASLTETQRTLMHLRYHEGLSMRDIASRTGRTESAVTQAILQARRVLCRVCGVPYRVGDRLHHHSTGRAPATPAPRHRSNAHRQARLTRRRAKQREAAA